MVECNFCGKQVIQGTGKLYIFKDGKSIHFCGSKCEKNQIQLKRKPIKFKWTRKEE